MFWAPLRSVYFAGAFSFYKRSIFILQNILAPSSPPPPVAAFGHLIICLSGVGELDFIIIMVTTTWRFYLPDIAGLSDCPTEAS